MQTAILHLNLVIAWVWILLGFGSGLILGLNFHKENWLGGYSSYPRRMYRLAHIAFFGLAIVNLLFYVTAQQWPPDSQVVRLASRSFVIGAISMPLCCVLMAQSAKWRMLFAVPILSLTAGAILTLWEVIL